MPELARFNAMEMDLHLELPPDVQAPRLTSWPAHGGFSFQPIYRQTRSFRRYPDLMAMGEG